MKNLENYGVQSLNAKEITEIDGGFLVALATLALVVGIGAGLVAIGEAAYDAGHYIGSQLN